MPDNEQKKYVIPNNGEGWQTGDVITADKMNTISNALAFTSEEIDNAINGTIYGQKNNDILARKLDGLVKYFTTDPNENNNNNNNLEYTRFYAKELTKNDQQIIVPTLDEYNTFTEGINNNYTNFKQNFVQPYSKDKAYTKGEYVEYNEEVYKLLTSVAAKASAQDDSAAWNTISDDSKQKVNVLQELGGLINVYNNQSQLSQEKNKIWINTQSNEVEVPTYEEFSDLKSQLAFTTKNEFIDDWTEGFYYVTSSSVTNIQLDNKKKTNGYLCAYRTCKYGDIFYYTGHGTSAARSWAFLKENGDIISGIDGRAAADDYINRKIIAPEEAAYVIFNSYVNYYTCVVIGEILPNKITDLQNTVDNIQSEVDAFQNEIDDHAENIISIENTLSRLLNDKTANGTGELIEEFTQVTDVTITGATSAIIRNAQIFEPLFPGTDLQYGVKTTKNSDGTYTFDGLASSSAWYYLNQSSRNGTSNIVTINGEYSFRAKIVSGSWEAVTYEGGTLGIMGIQNIGVTPVSNLVSLTLGNSENTTFSVDSDTNIAIGFRLTAGVQYNNLRIEFTLNKGNKLLPYTKYAEPTTITNFTDIASIVKKYVPSIWIQTIPATASIFVTGLISKSDGSDESAENPESNLYGVLEKYNDRVDTLAQMFLKPLFLIYTDIHGNDANLKRIDTWYKKNKPVYVSDVYCLGDMVQDQANDPITQFDDTTIWAKTLRVIGNHDVLASGTIPGITAVAAYEKYIAPAVANWDITQPADAATYGKNYYYKDYANKIRVIVLDTYFYTTDQHNWFVSTLESARTNSLAVIVAEHEDICTASEKQPLNADYPFARKYDGYTGLQYRTYGDGGNYETKRAAVDTFIGNGGTFVCWLVGHQHADMTGTYNGGINGKQLSVNLSNASNSMISSTRINNYSQDCFTYLSVDTDAHYLYLLRIGEAVDKWFHQNLFLCYDYVNHTVVEYH